MAGTVTARCSLSMRCDTPWQSLSCDGSTVRREPFTLKRAQNTAFSACSAPADCAGRPVTAVPTTDGIASMRISLVTPLYKSAPHIEELYRRSVAAMTQITPDYEIIFVNDGSPDNSLGIAINIPNTDHRVKVVDLSKNYGKHPALLASLQESPLGIAYSFATAI